MKTHTTLQKAASLWTSFLFIISLIQPVAFADSTHLSSTGNRQLTISAENAQANFSSSPSTALFSDSLVPDSPLSAVEAKPITSGQQAHAPFAVSRVAANDGIKNASGSRAPIQALFEANHLPAEASFLKKLSDGVYEMEIDDYFQALLEDLLPDNLTKDFTADDLVNVELAAVRQRIQEGLAGLFDFVVAVPTTLAYAAFENFSSLIPPSVGGLPGFGAPEKSDIDGIGFIENDSVVSKLNETFGPLFNTLFSPFMGAAKVLGQLQGSVWLDPQAIDNSGFITGLEYQLSVFLEELHHRWGTHLSTGGVEGANSLGILGRDNAHWSPVFDAGNSPMDGINWRDNGDGTFTIEHIYGVSYADFRDFLFGGSSEKSTTTIFNDFDLYAMGLLAPDDVNDSFLIQDPKFSDGQAIPTDETFLSTIVQRMANDVSFFLDPTVDGTKDTITIEEIIAIEGTRSPASASSDVQTDFSVGVVILKSEDDTNSSLQAVIDAVNALTSNIGSAWSTATRGLSTLTVGPLADAFSKFRDTVLNVFDIGVDAIKNGTTDADNNLTSAARQSDLDAEKSRANTNLADLANLEQIRDDIQALLDPLQARVAAEPVIGTRLGNLPTDFANLKTKLKDLRDAIEAGLTDADAIATMIADLRVALTNSVNQAQADGILPVAFGAGADASLKTIDDEFVRVTGVLDTASDDFEAQKAGLNTDLTTILNALQHFHDEAAHTFLAGEPIVSASGGVAQGFSHPTGKGTIQQTNPREFTFSYNLNGGEGAFAFSQIRFDSTRLLDLSSDTNLVFGIKGPSGRPVKLKVEVEDFAGRVANFEISLTDSFQNFTLALSGSNIPAGFDVSKVRDVRFVIDRTLANFNFVNDIMVQTAGLDFRPVVTGATLDASKHTVLPNEPILNAGGGRSDALLHPVGKGKVVNQTSNKAFTFDYNLNGGPTAFAFLVMDFPSGGVADFSSTNKVEFGLKGPTTGRPVKVKAEVKDVNGKVADFELVLTNAFQNFALDLTGDNIPTGFDVTKIDEIVFSIDRDLANFNYVNQIMIQTAGVDYQPVVTGTTHDTSRHTDLPGDPAVNAGGGRVSGFTHPTGKGKIIRTGSRDFTFDYNLNGGTSAFAFAAVDFNAAGSADLSSEGKVEVGIKGPAGRPVKVKAEVKDVNGRVADFQLVLTNGFQNFILDLSTGNIPPGFDTSKVKEIVFVIDRDLANFNYVNQIMIQMKGLDYRPEVSGTAFNAGVHTLLNGSPVVNPGNGRVLTTHPTGKAKITQTSPRDFLVDYNLNGGPTAFAFAAIDFNRSALGDFSSNNQITFGLKGPAGRPVSVKVEVKDVTGRVADFELNLTNTLQNFTLDLAGDNVPDGFSTDKIDEIVFVIDRTMANFNFVNQIQMVTNGLNFIPTITGSAHNTGNHTTLQGDPNVFAGNGRADGFSHPTGKGKAIQSGSSAFTFDYNLNGGPTAFAFAGIDFPGTTVGDFSSNNQIVFGIKGPSGRAVTMKIEVKDTNGNIADFHLTLTNSFQNFTLNLSGDNVPAGFDTSKIDEIVFVIDRGLANFNYVNQIMIQTNGLRFTPVINGVTRDDSKHTLLPNFPPLTPGDGRVATTHPTGKGQVIQSSNREFLFDYNLNGGFSAFAFAFILFNAGQELDISGSRELVFAAKGPVVSGSALKDRAIKMKVEVKDSSNRVATFTILLTKTMQNFVLPFNAADLPAGFDLTKIKEIVFVVDRDLTNFNYVNQIQIKTGEGVAFTPTVSGTPLDDSKHTLLPGEPPLGAGGGRVNNSHPPGTASVIQTSTKDFTFDYDLTGGTTAFAFAFIVLPSVTDFTSAGQLTFGLKGPATGNNIKLKVEVKDSSNRVAKFILSLTKSFQNFQLDLNANNLPAGFDATQVKEVVFVMDRDLANNNFNNQVAIKTAGLDFQPVVTGTALDATQHTLLPNNPNLFSGGGRVLNSHAPGVGQIVQQSSEAFTFDYDVSGGVTAFAFSGVAYGAGNEVDFSGNPEFTFAAKGPATGNDVRMKVEVKDANLKVADFIVVLTKSFQNFKLELTGDNLPPGFDVTKVKEVVFVIDQLLANSNFDATIDIQTKGLNF